MSYVYYQESKETDYLQHCLAIHLVCLKRLTGSDCASPDMAVP